MQFSQENKGALVLNTEQCTAIDKIKDFLSDRLDAFILSGSAGTGKTTLIAKLILDLTQSNTSFVLWAPTGRASRILSNKIRILTNQVIEASTIHKAIYWLEKIDVNEEEALSKNDPALRFICPLKQDECTASLIIIDASSMIGNKKTQGDLIRFGSGSLLDDIIEYMRINRHNRSNDLVKILFVGDLAQLPPISDNISPALS